MRDNRREILNERWREGEREGVKQVGRKGGKVVEREI